MKKNVVAANIQGFLNNEQHITAKVVDDAKRVAQNEELIVYKLIDDVRGLSSPDEVFLLDNNFGMSLLGEGFDATIEGNERFVDHQLASNLKMIESSRADLPESFRRAIEYSPKTKKAGLTHWTTEGSIDTNANSDAAQNQSTGQVNSENQTGSERVSSDKKDTDIEIVDCKQLEKP